ncbi:MAG TPA: glycosyltransferase N-terminal domain-containing protein, partial [Burkholderiaceae bacterium]|nr:glycosyltransferase N-terminal domain-containing protein [Burkholderiaceae bacterium]
MFPQAGSRFLWQMLYNLLLPVALLGARIAARRNPKLRETLSGQRTASKRMQGSLPGRDPARPLLWFHVASAGEFLQALPVLERCVASGAQAVLTVTSVSGMRWVERRRGELPVLAADYLPLDTSRNARRLLETLEPAALIFTKYDLWPNLVWTAASAGVPQFLISATLHARSWRARSALARSLYRTLYAPLAGIFAVTEDDAERFLQTCPGHPGVEVVGDTRFDSVLERRDRVAVPPLPPYEDRVGAAKPQGMVQRNGIVLVIGSSWPPDEACYLPGLLEALERYPTLRVVLAPHEIDPGHLVAMEE